jgi:hypothetical protein
MWGSDGGGANGRDRGGGGEDSGGGASRGGNLEWRGEIHDGRRGAMEVCGGGRRRSEGERRRRWMQGVHGGEPRRHARGYGGSAAPSGEVHGGEGVRRGPVAQ